MVQMAKIWSLSNVEATSLFGVTLVNWDRMKAGAFKGEFDEDQMTRIAHLLGKFKGLNMLFNGPLADGWPKRANSGSLFNGQSPVTSMIEGGLPSIKKVKLHIEALRCGA